jgi:hypothetical protein
MSDVTSENLDCISKMVEALCQMRGFETGDPEKYDGLSEGVKSRDPSVIDRFVDLDEDMFSITIDLLDEAINGVYDGNTGIKDIEYIINLVDGLVSPEILNNMKNMKKDMEDEGEIKMENYISLLEVKEIDVGEKHLSFTRRFTRLSEFLGEIFMENIQAINEDSDDAKSEIFEEESSLIC